MNRATKAVRQFIDQVKPGEARALVLAFAYFFCLLCGYFMLRPLREALGIAGGVQQLHWMFTATFAAMLLAVPAYGWLVRSFPKKQFLPLVYLFFLLQLLGFYFCWRLQWQLVWAARVFFVWISVYNLFVVSVFWSLMADIFSRAQSLRLFGIIAAGGTMGALCGPALTGLLAGKLPIADLMLVAAFFLCGAMVCQRGLLARPQPPGSASLKDARGSILAAFPLVFRSKFLLMIALFMLLYTILSTFIYYIQAHEVSRQLVSPEARTAFFARIDLAVNGSALAIQLLLTSYFMRRGGAAAVLAGVPLLIGCCMALLAASPALPAVALAQVMHRSGNFSLLSPTRESLYTLVSEEEKYKAKNFIDTVIFRGGDALSAWALASLASQGLGSSALAWLAVPFALAWSFAGWQLGNMSIQKTKDNV